MNKQTKKTIVNARAAGLSAGIIFGAGAGLGSLWQSAGWSTSWIHLPIGPLSFLPSEGFSGALSQALGHFVYGFVCGFIALYAGILLYKKFSR